MEGDNGRGGVSEVLLQDNDYYAPPNGNGDGVVIDAENGVSSDDRCRSLKRRISRTVSVPNATSQTALIGAHVSPIESLDYEIAENALLQQEWHAETPLIALHYIILKWILALVVGVMTGVTAFLINLSVEKITGANLLKTTYYMDQGRIVMACTILFGSNILLVLSSALLCAYVGPAAAGSGIPEVKAYLNGIDAPNILSPRTLIVKIFGSIGSVAGGLYVGKEGPLVHTGACFASLLSQGGSTRYHLTWKWLRYFKNDRDRRDLVTCGAAAGVASAFRAPVGGVLFALEEAASWWRSSLLWRAFFATTVVAVMLRYLIALCGSGGLKICGSGGLIMFDIGDIQMDFGLRDLLPATALGVVGGLLGSLFTLINGKVVKTYSFWFNKRGRSAKVLQAVILSVVTSACIFGLPWLATCKVCPSSGGNAGECPSKAGSSGKYQQFGCPAGHYNDLAGLLFNTKDNVIRNLFSTGTSGEIQSSSLLIFLVTSFALTVVTYGSALPSGLFVPVIIMGACYGRLTGMLLHSKEFNEGIYAVLGAASFLGGSMRMTVSLCVILLELTNSLPMLPLVMLVLLISKTIGDLFTHSIYDQILQIKALPFLEENPEPYMNQLTAQDVCASPLVTLSGVERVETILQVLKETNHNAFPVLNIQSSPPLLMGIILRDHLLVILKRKAFLPGFKGQLSWVDFAKPGSGKGIRIEDIEKLTEEEKHMAVDLRPFTNTSPYTVVDTMSLAKAYSLFRSLGLRHLCVVSTSLELQPIVGLLTRHDFMEEHVLSLYPHLKSSTWKRLRFRPIIMQVAQWGRFQKAE